MNKSSVIQQCSQDNFQNVPYAILNESNFKQQQQSEILSEVSQMSQVNLGIVNDQEKLTNLNQEHNLNRIAIFNKLLQHLNKFKQQNSGEIDQIINYIEDIKKNYKTDIENKQNKYQTLLENVQVLIEQSNLYDLKKQLINFSQTLQLQILDLSKKILTELFFFSPLPEQYVKQFNIKQNINNGVINCQKHSEQKVKGIFLKPNNNRNQIIFCYECNKEKPTSFESRKRAQELWVQYINERIQYCQSFQDSLCIYATKMKLQFYSQYQSALNKLQNFEGKIDQFVNQKTLLIQDKIFKLLKKSLDISKYEDQKKLIEIYQQQDQIDYKIKLQLSNMEFTSNKITKEKINQYLQASKNLQNLLIEVFEYKLQEKYSINQNEQCCAIAINNKATHLVAASNKIIKVYEYKNGNLKEIQKLDFHDDIITCLEFMNLDDDMFVSGSSDCSIVIWYKDKLQNKWNSKQQLKHHNKRILCLIINKFDDLIISGGQDKQIIFYQKDAKDKWQHIQTILKHNNDVNSISLNENNDTLISTGIDKKILIFKQDNKKQWQVIQEINTNKIGFRLSFINNQEFIFLPKVSKSMDIYQLNNNQFQQNGVVQLSDWFSQFSQEDIVFFQMKFIKDKNILLSKNGSNIDIIYRVKKGEYCRKYTIDMQHNCLFGTISKDGKYIITWDEASKQIQVRQFSD